MFTKPCVICGVRSVKLHWFQPKYPEVIQKWLLAINKPELFKLTHRQLRHKGVCGLHFLESDKIVSRHGLKVSAVPQLFLGGVRNEPHNGSTKLSDTEVLSQEDTEKQQKPAAFKCRTCLKEDEVFPYSILDCEVRKMLMACTDIELKVNIHLPGGICLKCYDSLVLAYNFKCQAENIEQHLQERIFSVTKGKEANVTQPSIKAVEVLETPKTKELFTVQNTNIVIRTDIPPEAGLSGYQCTFCDEIFSTKISWANHQYIHMETLYLCSYCGRSFDERRAMLNHEYSHTKQPTLDCHLCLKKFHTVNNLQRHQSSHATFLCSTCGEMLANKNSFRQHTRTHLPKRKKIFKRQVKSCGKSNSAHALLAYNKKRHKGINLKKSNNKKITTSDERPFECSICHKKFFTTLMLENHIVTHSAEEPYSCEWCQFRTNHKPAFRKHMIGVHGDTCNTMGTKKSLLLARLLM